MGEPKLPLVYQTLGYQSLSVSLASNARDDCQASLEADFDTRIQEGTVCLIARINKVSRSIIDCYA